MTGSLELAAKTVALASNCQRLLEVMFSVIKLPIFVIGIMDSIIRPLAPFSELCLQSLIVETTALVTGPRHDHQNYGFDD